MKVIQFIFFISKDIGRLLKQNNCHDGRKVDYYFDRLTEEFKLEGISGDCLVQPRGAEQGEPEQGAQGSVQSGFE